MKSKIYISLLLLFPAIFPFQAFAQLEVNSNVTPEEMVEFFIGPGISYSNAQYSGAQAARGIFSNGSSTNLGVDHGIALTTGLAEYIIGPNSSYSMSYNNNMPGDDLLGICLGGSTYDASVLEFEFIPSADTAWCRYVFGSEEYSEWVGSAFNDIFGYFVSGPDPDGGFYSNENIALIPGSLVHVAINSVNNGYASPGEPTIGPGTNSEYFFDNLDGETIQYDGFTTVLIAKIAVIPGENYHFKLAIADAGDGIYDSGVMLEGQSFKSQGSADFLSFAFMAESNPGLNQDIYGVLENDAVTLEVPAGTNVTGLVASFETNGGVVVGVGGIPQQSGITPNDFTQPVMYHLDGYNDKDWQVKVNMAVGIGVQVATNAIFLSGSAGKFEIRNISKTDIIVYSITGSVIRNVPSSQHGNSVVIDNLMTGIYFVKLSKDGKAEVRKVQVN